MHQGSEISCWKISSACLKSGWTALKVKKLLKTAERWQWATPVGHPSHISSRASALFRVLLRTSIINNSNQLMHCDLFCVLTRVLLWKLLVATVNSYCVLFLAVSTECSNCKLYSYCKEEREATFCECLPGYRKTANGKCTSEEASPFHMGDITASSFVRRTSFLKVFPFRCLFSEGLPRKRSVLHKGVKSQLLL